MLPDLDEIHVWRADLDIDAPARERLLATLAPDERERAARFRHERDRERYVVSHGILRAILGGYVAQAPGALIFERNRFGKPNLRAPGADSLAFNLSRAGALMVCVVGSRARIGVDVESTVAFPREGQDLLVAFAASERAAIERLPIVERSAAIAACWTRKEAFVKARGEGLSQRFDTFEVTVPPDPPRLLRSVTNPTEAERWSLISIAPDATVVGTIAIDRPGSRITPREWRAGRE
jgi:4'-phosphopantetheinyl transferase